MSSSDEQKLLCIKEYPDTNIKDWKRICKYSHKFYGTIRVFENKKENLYITIYEDEDGETYIHDSKLTNKPEDYVFGVGVDDPFNQGMAFAFIQPKFGDSYDQENILDFCLDARKLGFFEESEASYSYAPNEVICESSAELKAKLIELGLEHSPKYDWNNNIEYTDMTPEQQEIIDAGLRPPAGTVPANLNPQEMLEWVRTMAGMTPNILYCQLEETDEDDDEEDENNEFTNNMFTMPITFTGMPEYDFVNELYNSKDGCSTYTIEITAEDWAEISIKRKSIIKKWVKIEFEVDADSESYVYKNFSNDSEQNIRIVKVEIVHGKSVNTFEEH